VLEKGSWFVVVISPYSGGRGQRWTVKLHKGKQNARLKVHGLGRPFSVWSGEGELTS